MKIFQPKLLCMKDKKITISNPSGWPNNHYPNSHKYGYHDFFELEFFVTGYGTHYINGIPYEVKPGYFYLLFPGDMHCMQLDCSKKYDLWNLKFDLDIPQASVIKEIEKFARPICLYAEEHFDFLKNELSLLDNCVNNKLWNEGMAKNVIDRILNISLYLLNNGTSLTQEHGNTSIYKIIEYVNKNYYSKISLSVLAKLINLSENYIGIYFKRNTGMNLSDFLIKTRLQHAVRLLEETNLSIKEITFKIGFNSPEYFCKCFKQAFGSSPTQFKKQTKTATD